jgi:hypothetical protein
MDGHSSALRVRLGRIAFVSLPAVMIALSATAYAAGATPTTAPAGSHSAAPVDTTIKLGGATVTALAPGTSAPVDLTLYNPSDKALVVNRMAVRIAQIQRPNGQPANCAPDNFTIRQFSGSYGFSLTPDKTTGLAELNIPQPQWPQLTLLNLPMVNQDGCKDTTITISVTATGTAPRT